MAATVGCAGLAAAGQAAPAPRDRCAVGGTTTIQTTKDVRVYYRGDRAEHRVFACQQRSGRKRALGSFDSSEGPGIVDPIISGRFVAYQFLDCEADCANSDVRVMDLSSGRIRRSARAGANAGRLDGLVLKSNGSVAWIRDFLDRTAQVRALSASGEKVVDSGDIEGGSLAVAASRIYWIKAGIPMTALLD